MAHQKPFSLIILVSLIPLFFILTQAKPPTAPEPESTEPIDIIAILKKAGQYNTFIKFLIETSVGNTVNHQVNHSNDGVTVFAPSDNAFNSLQSCRLNNFSEHQKKQLMLYHVITKFYTLDELERVSNPVRTLAVGENGDTLGLKFTGQNNQMNVSSGSVVANVYKTPIYTGEDPPLVVYQLDKVLVPSEFIHAKTPSSAPAPAPASDTTNNGTSSDKATADEPNDAKRINVGFLALISGVFLIGTLS